MSGRIKDLERMVGRDNVLYSAAALATYACDATQLEGRADAVVFPESTKQVSAVMRFCHQRDLPVTARGHGTDLSGGCVPLGGVVMAFTRMNRILSIDAPNRLAVVQPGVVNMQLQAAVDRFGLMYAPDPASQKVCSLGGNVAKGAGGMRGLKYGVTKDHVLGLEIVLADGEVGRVGAALDSPEAGLDWVGLLVGSEGTLALVTEITARLLPKPPAVKTMLAVFDQVEAAGEAVSQIVAEGLLPATLELMDRTVVEAVEGHAHVGLPTDVEAVLLIEVDGLGPALDRQAAAVRDTCRRHGAREVRVAQSAAERDALWLGRRAAIGALARLRPCYDLEDATVPRGCLTEMLRQVKEVAREYRLQVGILAHAGDGNLHPLLLFDDSDPEETGRVRAAREELFRRALALGGTLSGEHGIGLLKRDFMPWLYTPASLRVMHEVKRAFDPRGVLNPGKVLGHLTPGHLTPGRVTPRPFNDDGRLGQQLEVLLGKEVVRVEDEVTVTGSPGRTPAIWVAPVGRDQVETFLAWATRTATPVYPRGGATRWKSAFRHFGGGVGIDLRRLDDLVDLDSGNLTVVAGAGLTHRRLQESLAAHRLFLPTETPFPDLSTLGGEVAADTSGPREYAYGSPRRYLLGCEVVFPDGSVGEFGGRQVKNASGYNLSRFVCGSWGSLGVITKATLRVMPRPERSEVCLFAGAPHKVLAAAERARLELYGATAIEVLLGQAALQLQESLLPGSRDEAEAAGQAVDRQNGVLMVALDGPGEDVSSSVRRLQEMAECEGLVPWRDSLEAQGVWTARYSLESDGQGAEERWNLAVLPAELGGVIADLLRADQVVARLRGVRAHAGNGRACLIMTSGGAGPGLLPTAQTLVSRGGYLVPEDAALIDGPQVVLPVAAGSGKVWRRLKQSLDPASIMTPAGWVGATAR